MLVLGRRENESIILKIGTQTVTVEVVRIANGMVRLGIEAAKEVKILRGELELREVVQ